MAQAPRQVGKPWARGKRRAIAISLSRRPDAIIPALMGISLPHHWVPPNGPEEAPQQGVPPVTTGGFFFSAYPLLALMLRDEWCLEGY